MQLCGTFENKNQTKILNFKFHSDHSDFIDTDIPLEVSLPEKPGISVKYLSVQATPHIIIQEDKREEIKEWVLAVSMDQITMTTSS